MDAQAFRSLKYIYVGNGAEPDDVLKVLDAAEHGGRITLQLENVETRVRAAELVHSYLYISGEQAEKRLKKSAAEAFALEGYRVMQDGKFLGVIRERMARPPQDILILEDTKGRPVMLPYTDAFIRAVDKKNALVHVVLPEGIMHED